MAGPVGVGAFLEIAAGAARAYPKVQKVITGLQATNDVLSKVSENASAAKKQMMSMLNAIGGKWVEMQDIAFKTGRSMAMSREMAMRYDRMLMQSTKDLARQYGITAKEIAQFQEEYGKNTGRNVLLTDKQIESMAALSKITDSATAAQLVDDFDKLGIGIEGSTARIGLLQERAKAFGVNASKAAKNLASNIQLASRYSFKNGVADLEKMAIKSASLRMDMNAVMNAADKFMDIEGAIGTSARLQMLGGSFGAQFSNPMGAMYEAMADPKAFMDRLEKTVAGKGRYNEKTGQVTFDPVTMMQMREAAKQLGMSVEQLTNPAMAKVQDDVVQKELEAAGTWGKWTKVEQEAIQNLSRTNVDENTGKHYVTLLDENGEKKNVNVEDLTKEQLKIAQDSQMTEEGLFSDVQDIKKILEDTLGRARGTTSTKENIQGLGAEWDAFAAQFQNMLMPMVSGWMNGNSFQPWDLFKNLSYYPGRTDFGSHATEGFGFAEGGVVKPIQASVGAIVPGTSYAGDKVPAMVNSGEMILNEREQSGLFSILKSIATTGAMMYGGNKLGKMFGMRGLGLQMGLGNLLSGGRMGIGGMLGQGAGMIAMNKMMGGGMMPMQMNPMMPMGGMNRPFTFMNPTVVMNGETIMNGDIGGGELVEQLTDVADAAADVTKNTRSFSARLRDLSKRNTFLGKGAKFARTTKAWGLRRGRKLSNIANAGKNWFNNLGFIQKSKAYKDFLGKSYFDSSVGRYRTAGKFVGKGNVGNWFTKGVLRGKGFFKNIGQDISSLSSGGGEVAKAVGKGNVGNWFTKGVLRSKGFFKNIGQDISSLSSGGGEVAKAVGKGGKLMGTLSKAGKFVGKGIPILGNALAIGSAISDMSSASSQYDAQISEIERSGMSDMDKARAKDRAAKEKNASYGSSIGSAAGTAIGGALGSALGPLGTVAGMWLGEKAGSFLGKTVGGLFGGGEEEKLLKQQEESAKAIAGNNEEIIKVLKSIEGKMPGSSRIGSNFGLKPLELESSVIQSLPLIGPMMTGIKAVGGLIGGKGASAGVGNADINLNVSGTIKLEGGNKSVDLDLNKLLDTPEFKRQLTDIISKRLNEVGNAGKTRNETSRNNTANIYNKNNKG